MLNVPLPPPKKCEAVIIFNLIVTNLNSADQKSDFEFIVVNVNSEFSHLFVLIFHPPPKKQTKKQKKQKPLDEKQET